jgi:hypothetical protein
MALEDLGKPLQEALPGVVGAPLPGKGREEAHLNGVAEEGGLPLLGEEVGQAAGEVKVGQAQNLKGHGVAPPKGVEEPAIKPLFP